MLFKPRPVMLCVADVTELLEKLRDSEVEIRILQNKLRALEGTGNNSMSSTLQSVHSSDSGSSVGPSTHRTRDAAAQLRLSGPAASQYRVERALRLSIAAGKAHNTSLPVSHSTCRRIENQVQSKCYRMDDGAFQMPSFDALVAEDSGELPRVESCDG